MEGREGHLERFRGNSVAGGRRERLPGTLSRGNRARWTAEKDTWNAFTGIPWQVDGGEMPPGTLSRGYRGRWEAGKATWNDFAGIPWQVGGGKGYLERFHGDSVAGGRREETPGTLSQEFRGRWEARKVTWNAFAGIPWQVGSKRCYLTRFRRDSVAGGRRGDATWNAFAGIPWQVGGGKGYLERFCRDTVAGGRRERLPGTLLREYRGRWEAGKATWNAFTGIPWQVDGREGHLEHFRRKTVAGGQRDETPGTLSQENRGRWTAG